jgi:hypothetical protein
MEPPISVIGIPTASGKRRQNPALGWIVNLLADSGCADATEIRAKMTARTK